MELSKDNIKIGITTMGGHGILGSITNIPSMPGEAATASKMAGTGLNLSALGMLTKTGMDIVKMPSKEKKFDWGL